MSIPHKCPVCDGIGRVQRDATTTDGDGTALCPACDGKCVVWSPDVPHGPVVPWVAPGQPWPPGPWWYTTPMCVSPMAVVGPVGEWKAE